jgi:peptidoglycan/LPS O-acetylase OafA/YrhL
MKRNFGLDVMRAVAILMVLFDHAWYFNTHIAAEFNPWVVFGFIGVELFFVLSGFLIGQIVLRDLITGINRQKIVTFYIRRWLRTLPLYYIVLVFFIIASNYIYHTSELHPFHFVFLQNFIPSELYFLSIAWSLAIEEWFYITLPLFLYPFFRKHQSPRRMLPIVVASILAIVAARILFAYFVNIDFEHIRRLIPERALRL